MRVHCCVLDRQCLMMARRYGAPLCLHVGGWSMTLLANNRRSKRLYEGAWERGDAYKRDPATGRLVNRFGESPRHRGLVSDTIDLEIEHEEDDDET